MTFPQRFCLLPQRYLIAILLHLGIVATFGMRVSLGVALKYMTVPTNKTSNISTFCKVSELPPPFVPPSNNLFPWEKKELQDVNYAFFWGYMLGHFPGGYLSDFYGGKHTLGVSVLVTAITNLLVPLVVNKSGSSTSLLVMRALIGLGVGMLFPSVHTLMGNWVPLRDRGKLSGICFAATQFCIAFNHAFSPTLITTTEDWSSVFYFFGGMSIIWCAIWHFIGTSTFPESRFISRKEIGYLQHNIGDSISYGKKSIPVLEMLSSLPLWSLIIAQFGHLWMWHIMITELPVYNRNILGYDVMHSHRNAAISYLACGILTICFGFLSDFLIVKGHFMPTMARKVFTTLGAMGPAIFILAAAFSDCHRTVSIVNFTIGLGMMSFYYAGTRVNTLDLAPNFNGIVFALVNGIGVIPALVIPEIMKRIITQLDDITQWRVAFSVFLGVRTVSVIPFILFGSAREQRWNRYGSKLMLTTTSTPSDLSTETIY